MELQFLDRTQIYMKLISEGDVYIFIHTQTLRAPEMYRTTISRLTDCQNIYIGNYFDI